MLLFIFFILPAHCEEKFKSPLMEGGFKPLEDQLALPDSSEVLVVRKPATTIFQVPDINQRFSFFDEKTEKATALESSESKTVLSKVRLPRQQKSSRQLVAVPGGVDFSQATRTADGRLCVIKEERVETLSKDPILECKHKNVEKCHYTYITYFKPAQEEACEENFEKSCQITFKQEAVKETIRKCYRPVEKVCNGQGARECRTVYESSCSTRYIDQGNGKFVGDTKCEKKPVEICGQGCVSEEGPEECHDKQVSHHHHCYHHHHCFHNYHHHHYHNHY